jgi:cell wall-associated NlpC family hydrolase
MNGGKSAWQMVGSPTGSPRWTPVRLPALGLALMLGACGTAPTTRAPPASPDPVTRLAQEQVGRPYVYGGEGPRGFDCSGLVYYAYRQALGLEVPRTAREQLVQARRVSAPEVRAGDLVFFQPASGKDLHVGIYVQDDLFVHAPSSGKRVSYASLADPYWRENLIAAGRLRQ